MGCRCLLPTRRWELEPSYTPIEEGVGNRCIQLSYTGVQAQCLHMLFLQPIPATNMRMLAGTSRVRQAAGGFCPVLSSHREACLEASSQLAAFLWQGEGSSILRQEVPRLPLYCTWNTVQVCIVNLRLRGLWQKSLVKTWKLTLQAVWNCEGLRVSSTLSSKMILDKAFSYLLTYGT